MKKILTGIVLSTFLLGSAANIFAAGISEGFSKEEIASFEKLKAELETANSYSSDYKVLISKLDKKTYMEVLTETKPLIGSVKTEVVYEGKSYNKTAFLHAAIHNFATRTKSGYIKDGVLVWNKNQEESFTDFQKAEVMPYVYQIITQYSFNPADRIVLRNFALEVEKIHPHTDVDKATLAEIANTLHVGNADTRQKEAIAVENRIKRVNAIAFAMEALPVLSITPAEKDQAAEIIYDRIRGFARADRIGVVGNPLTSDVRSGVKIFTKAIESGMKALLQLNTKVSLEKYKKMQKVVDKKI